MSPTRRAFTVGGASAASLACSPSNAQSSGEGRPAFEVPRSEVRIVQSQGLGRDYRLYVKLPPGYSTPPNQDKTYPTIWLTDDAYVFQTAAGVTHLPMNFGGVEHAILVGMSYAVGESGLVSRSRDYTPTRLQTTATATTNGPHADAGVPNGGASAYLDFIASEAIPFIEREYRASAKRSLVGQSYGGLLCAYTLLTRPGLFSGYLMTSPSLWFDDGAIFRIAQDAPENARQLSGRAYLATGATEGSMIDDQGRFAALLRQRGWEVRDEVVEGATHQTTFPIGFTRGSRRP